MPINNQNASIPSSGSSTNSDEYSSSGDGNYGSDYSSDASTSHRTSPVRRQQQEEENGRHGTNRRRRPPVRSAGTTPVTSSYQMPVYPLIYKFSEIYTKKNNLGDTNIGTMRNESERVDICNLKELVKYTPADLCARAWYLLPAKIKSSSFPLYDVLPSCPNLFEVTFVDTNDVCGFMCNVASEFLEAGKTPTSALLRSLLVSATVKDEVLKMKQSAVPLCSFEDADFDPHWETDANIDDLDLNESAECEDISMTDFNIALAVPLFEEKMSLYTLKSLHQLFNKCLQTFNSEVLRSWGVQHLMQVLLKQSEDEVERHDFDRRWVPAAIGLLYKMMFTTGSVDTMLALLRWSYRQSHQLASCQLAGVLPLVNVFETFNLRRVRVPLSSTGRKGQLISFPHVLSNGSIRVKGLCVVEEDGEQACILLTEKGVLKVSLKPPFNILCRDDFYIPDACHGAFVEDNFLAVIGDSGCSVDMLDTRTLTRERTLHALDTISDRFACYCGAGKFVNPYFLCGGILERQPFFNGSEVSGVVEPSVVLLPRTCDSLSMQFFVCPSVPHVTTNMTVISLTLGDKTWLLVRVILDPGTLTQRIIFEHGAEVVAEVEESISPTWALWSATLTSINDSASWTVYKNGAVQDAVSKTGSLLRSLAPLQPMLLSGSFSGFLSGVQVWSRAQNIGDMKISAIDGKNPNRSQFLLCSFRMDEGVGCCLHSSCTGMIWRAASFAWGRSPTRTLQKAQAEEKVFWKPSGNYHVVTNEFEIAIIDEHLTTWVDMSGKILEQNDTKLSPRDKHFYDTKSGRLFFVAQDHMGIRSISTNCPASSYIKDLPSMQAGEALSREMMEMINRDSSSSTASESNKRKEPLVPVSMFGKYMTYKLNTAVLTGERIAVGRKKFFSLDQISAVSLRTIGRLLAICRELLESVEKKDFGEFEELLLCVVGRLLQRQVTLMERQCPDGVVTLVVDANTFLQSADSTLFCLGDEVKQVFAELHQVVLSECVSHDYQLKLIIECKRMCDVKQLLVPQNVPPLVDCVIKKDMKKPFMTFLNKLKEECQSEAVALFSTSKVQFDASAALLATVLSMLSQKEKPQWHLVAVALICSLCKAVMRLFEKHFTKNAERNENAPLLMQTCVGSVLFPVVHLLYEMEFDKTVVNDVLKVLNDIRNCLRPYRIEDSRASKAPVHFLETHSVVISPQHTAAFVTTLSLQHARTVRLEVNSTTAENPTASTEEPENSPQFLISFIDNELTRFSGVLAKGELTINSGGRLTVVYSGESDIAGVSVIVHADVEFMAETTNWVNDICVTLGKTIVKTSYKSLLSPTDKSECLSRDSFFRGGLSQDALQGAKIDYLEEDDESTAERATLIRYAENTNGEFATFWADVFKTVKLPFVDRLGCAVRWAACALVWHTRNPGAETTLEFDVGKAVEWFKQKAIFLLERIQQGKQGDLLERARFLLTSVIPRCRVEAQLLEMQHTEEPVTADPGTDRASRRHSRSVRSVDQRSRFGISRQRLTTDLSIIRRWGNTSAMRRTETVNIFSSALKEHSQPTAAQLLAFLTGGGESIADTTKAFLDRTSHAITHIFAYKLQEDLCRSRHDDHGILKDVIYAHLQYRRYLSECVHRDAPAAVVETIDGAAGTDADDSTAESGNAGTATVQRPISGGSRFGFSRHYTEHIRGCGLMRELELQRAGCSFVLVALRELLKELSLPPKVLPWAEAIGMCAVLCHPWDSVDMSILQPSDIFAFLYRLLSLSFTSRIRSQGERDAYFDSKGLLDLFHRCLITPNSLFLTTIEGVHIVDGEVQGLHVENVNVVCSARNHWKRAAQQHRGKRAHCDLYANYGLPCVVTEMPDVNYFEITLDLSVHDNPKVAMGVSSVALAPTEPVRTDDAVVFSVDGYVHFKSNSAIRFSDSWNVGDVIGCGVFAPSNSVFFTRNGEFLGVATQSTFTTFIPFVEVQGVNSLLKVIVNFGEEAPFAFDISTLHCSCRHHYITSTTVGDAALITADYLITMCYKNLSLAGEDVMVNQDAVSVLLEHAAGFLSTSVREFVSLLNGALAAESDAGQSEVRGSTVEPIVTMLARLLHCVGVIIECFRFDAVTARTHSTVLQLCCITLASAKDKSIKSRAAQCLSVLREVMREDYLVEATASLKHVIPAEEVVNQLVELARVRLLKEPENILPPPKWVGNTTVVRGNGTFFGSSPMPRKGTHMVGIRIARRNHQGQGIGTPLGGCYYLGLSHGQPQISNMESMLKRNDVFVLQDTDDKDQVAHLLLRRHCIPSNNYRRIYGNNEVVWVEFNADIGEITFYRENMSLIGLAFANIQRVDDLYPMVFLFNEDAWCEIVAPSSLKNESAEEWAENLRRSTATNALQQLHMVPYFSAAVSQMVHRAVTHLDRNLESCLVALAVLGGERSYLYCQHDSYGQVIVDSIAEISEKAVIYVANDEQRHLLSVPPQTLKPAFVQTPLYASGGPQADECALLLTDELQRSLYEASMITPLLEREQECRKLIEQEYTLSIEDVSSLDLVAILSQLQPRKAQRLTPNRSSTELLTTLQQSRSETLLRVPPTVIERQHSTISLFCPNPSIGVTTTRGCSIMRGNAIFSDQFTIAISIAQSQSTDLMYVGLTSSTSSSAERLDEIANWEDSWALCSYDSGKTNSVNCCVEPGMVFGGDVTIYGPRDVLLMSVSRSEGTVSFSCVRKHRTIDFGVLFDSIPPECVVRPFVACGPESVIVFSLADGHTFPARNTYPMSHFTSPCRDVAHCSVCDAQLSAPWYGGEDNVALCDSCFKSWQYPKDLFYVGRAPATAPEIPAYLISRYGPEKLVVNSYVEFEENVVPSWSSSKSVNAECNGASSISIHDECFMVTEPLSVYGNARVDVKLGYIAGVPGNPFSGLLSFTPLWRDGQQTRTSCIVPKESLFISSSVVLLGTKAVFSIKITDPTTTRTITSSGVFVGATNLSDAAYTVTRADLERLSSSNNIWGTWCDTKEKIAMDGTLFVLMDAVHGSIMVSSSLGGLYFSPFVITCSISAEDDQNLRFLLFSHDPCHIASVEGLASYSDAVEPSLSPIAIGLVPDSFNSPKESNFTDAIVLMDTIQRTETFARTPWRYTKHAEQSSCGTLIRVGDTVTIVQRSHDVLVFCQGVQIALVILNDQQARCRHRLMLYFSTSGLTATFVPPLYGRTHLGRVLRVYGPEVCVVECASDNWERECYAVRRKDIRFCALAASFFPSATIKEGLRVAYKIPGINLPKRGTIVSVAGTTVSVCDVDDDRSRTPLKLDHCFILDNEGSTITRQVLYALVTPPTNTIARVFEVGKSKYRTQTKGSYNGIMFDCRASDAVELISLSVLSQTTGRHRAEVFFRKGSHMNHEHDPRSWTQVFSGFVDMLSEQQFSVTFPAIHIESGSTFSLYINTSHNCGVGFFSEDSGFDGSVGDEFDNDGTITIYLGRKSGSSTAFGECSTYPRGFCGTVIYKQSKGSKPPLIEAGKEVASAQKTSPVILRGGVIGLTSRPLRTHMASSMRFTIEVLKSPIVVERVHISVLLQPCKGHPHGLSHCLLSMFYASLGDDENSRTEGMEEAITEDADLEWTWAWNSRVLLEGETTPVCVRGSDICLEKGRYVFIISVKNSMDEPNGNTASLLTTDDETYCKQNTLISVRGLFGEVYVEDDAPMVSGEQHTMTTGTYLNQNSSASYNGIMFDLRSKEDITLEEVYCISQTTQKHVTVRVFWKKDSMDGVENSPSQWTEVATSDLHLVDKQPFSAGELFLRMEAGQTYSIYINTSSNCGICFYSSSDGQVGEVGDEFENDGLLSVHVGLKSESSSPFFVIPRDARAFKGRLVYRTCSSSIVKSVNQAMFSCIRAYVVTRILVALTSYVDTGSRPTPGVAGRSSIFSYERLLHLASALATASSASITDLTDAENLLCALLKKSSQEEVRSGTVIVSLARGSHRGFSDIAKDDIALLADMFNPNGNTLVRLADVPTEDGTVMVRSEPDSAVFRASLQRLLPVTKCWQCGALWGSCASGTSDPVCPHAIPASEESRLASLVAHGIEKGYDVPLSTAQGVAEALLWNPGMNVESEMKQLIGRGRRQSEGAGHQLCGSLALDGCTHFSVPLRQLMVDDDDDDKNAFICPFVYSDILGANVSLYIKPRTRGVDVMFTTDVALRHRQPGSDNFIYFFALSLHCVCGSALSQTALTETRVLFVKSPNALPAVPLISAFNTSTFARLRTDDEVRLALKIDRITEPLATPVVAPACRQNWVWEDGTVEAQLNAESPVFLKDSFTEGAWPPGKPHFCSFVAISKGKEKTVFLEIHVVTHSNTRGPGLWSSAPRLKTSTRKPLTIASGELVTLGFSTEGEFFIFDADDVLRCRIPKEELGGATAELREMLNKIGFISVDQNEVTAHLGVPDDVGGSSFSSYTPELPFSKKSDGYDPVWVTYDPARVKVSKNQLTAKCCSDVGGQAVLGSPMPSSGISAFIVQLDRRDSPHGAPLGSGHFAGVAVSSFSQRAPHFRDLKSSLHPLWVVQDIQDGDSLPTQEQIPPLEREDTGRELYCCGTKLLFIVDRCAGTLSLARDNESPRIIFHDIPADVVLCPFVRLDHTTSAATLSRFAHNMIYSLVYHPSLERTASTQPMTPSLIRRFPFLAVLKLFPLLSHVVDALPPSRAAAMERCWNNLNVHDRYEYRVSKAVESLLELGGFARDMLHCAEGEKYDRLVGCDEVGRVVASLSVLPTQEVAVFAGCDSTSPAVHFRLPSSYEIVGHVAGTDMIRVLHVGCTGGAVERTLHLVYLDDPSMIVHSATDVLPHPFCICLRELLSPITNVQACGVVFDGWFDCSLAAPSTGSYSARDEKKIATAIVCALEHWHLHGTPHRHIMPENVFLRLVDGAVVGCGLWNGHFLPRGSNYASPGLKTTGMRDFKGDRWSCARLLRDMPTLLAADREVASFVQMLEERDVELSELLHESVAFQDIPENGEEGPSFTLTTGSRFREGSGSGSYNGIMFDVIAKSTTVQITSLHFVPDTNCVATVSLFSRKGSFMGSETNSAAWTKVVEREMVLSANVETLFDGFLPITISAGSRSGLFLHTTSGSGVLFYSETEGVSAGMGRIEEENNDIGITVGKKCESNQPFMAIQNQMRLIKGSITYTLIMRSSGPRSGLIYTYEGGSEGGPRKSDPDTSPVPVFVDGRGRGLHIRARHHESLSLVLLAPGVFEWLESTKVFPSCFADNDVEMKRLEEFMQAERLMSTRRRVRARHLLDTTVAGCNAPGRLRSLWFKQPGDMQTAVCYPLLCSEAPLFVSEPLPESCTLSISPTRSSRVCAFLVRCSDAEAEDCAVVMKKVENSRTLLHGQRKTTVYVDGRRHCFYTSALNTVVPVVGPDSHLPLRAVLCLSKGAGANAELREMRVHIHSREIDEDGNVDGAESIDRNLALLPCLTLANGTNATSPLSVVDDVVVSADRSTGALRLESVRGISSSVTITSISSDLQAQPLRVMVKGTGNRNDNVTVEMPQDSRNCHLMVRLLRFNKLRVVPKCILLVQSSSLEVDRHTVTQVLYSPSSKCVVSMPRLVPTEVHEVTLRIVCPLCRPPHIVLEHPSTSTKSIVLPYIVPAGFADLCETALGMHEVFVRLHVDLQQGKILVFSSDGSFCNQLLGKTCSTDLQLTFTLRSPASSVEVVEWLRSEPRSSLTLSAKQVQSIARNMTNGCLSANVSQTVGTITRHSARYSSTQIRDQGLTAAKQMEALIVNYARLLLERALVTQDAARQAAQSDLHHLLSFTSMRTHPLVSSILEGELRLNSLNLFAQSCVYLSLPLLTQSTAGVDTSINVIASAMRNDTIMTLLASAAGSSLVLLLLRTATIFSRSTRHLALLCVQRLLSNKQVSLPPHDMLCRHLDPLLRMMSGLCRRDKMSSAVVQIGVTLVADLAHRYRHSHLAHLAAPGVLSDIPFHIIVCARAMIDAITHEPPLPLPAAMIADKPTLHRITCEVMEKPITIQGTTAAYGVFTETDRDPNGTKSFDITINGHRKGAVIVGWNVEVASAASAADSSNACANENEPLPFCGYYIEPASGKVTVCLGQKKGGTPLRVNVKSGDVITVTCFYKEERIFVTLRRGNATELSTSFTLTEVGPITLPFFYVQHKADATLNTEKLSSTMRVVDMADVYTRYQSDPDAVDGVEPRSFDFYAELNLFTQSVLGRDRVDRLTSKSGSSDDGEDADEVTVLSHEIVSYTNLVSFIGAAAYAEKISVRPLQPYIQRLSVFDSITSAFSPLINLQRKSELFDIFRVLKNLCSRETEEAIQNNAIRPFLKRQGRKVHVTIHAMQAQPSASLGAFPTLMRSVFGQLYLQLHRTTADTFYDSPIFTVKLAGFGSADAGGPYRDVLSQLATEIMTAHPSDQFQLNPLFMQCGKGSASAIMPNPALLTSSQAPLMLEFFGKLLASFFITIDVLAVEFPPLFWRQLLSEGATTKDLTALDPDIVTLLAPESLMERTAEELEERFPGIGELWIGAIEDHPNLALDRALPPSTVEAAQLLADRVASNELSRFAEAIGYIQQGFDQVLPLSTLQAFRWQKVELLICGTQRLSFEAFRDECDVQLSEEDGAMFIKVLQAMSDEDRTLLLRFTTGQSRLPLKSRIKVLHSGSTDSLPTSSTCFFTLRLPTYTSIEKMKERILYASRQCKAIDADGQARETLILDI